MTFTVHKAVPLPSDNPLSSHALPDGFPLLVNDVESKIVEPVLVYQLRKLKIIGRRHWENYRNTAEAEAFDLRDWFAFLEHLEWKNPITQKIHLGKPWDLANETDYVTYRDTMQEIVSPYTKRNLANNTIRRRQGNVERFYKTAQINGWYSGEFISNKAKKRRNAHRDPSNEKLSRHASTSEEETSKFRQSATAPEPIRPLTKYEWELIKNFLGPMPSEARFVEESSRNRLASEVSIGSGLRVDEIASLTVYQLHSLYCLWQAADEEERIMGFSKLRVTKTKRAKTRDVMIPNYIIPELMAYMDVERKAAIEKARARAVKEGKRFKEPTTIFVNLIDSEKHAGNAVNATTLSRAFTKACLNAGVTDYVEKIDIDTKERYRVLLSKHVFHDLRHTFAVWKYHQLVANGDSEPWKEIQILLGHANLKTTMDTYLAVTNIDRSEAGKRQYAAKRALGEDA